VAAGNQFPAEQDARQIGRPAAVPGGARWQATVIAAALVVVSACGQAANRSSHSPEKRPTSTEAAQAGAAGDSLEPAQEADYSGLEKVAPEIVQLESWYREALQAVWNNDVATAEARAAALDSALADVDDNDQNQLVAIYLQGLETRVEKLKDLILEERTLQNYLTKVDSLSVISPEGLVDSTALSTLLERRVDVHPSSPRYDLELVENPLTQRWINFFTGDGRHYMELWLTRLPRYRELIDETLDEYRLPRDIIFLAMIESGLSLKAHSSANAVGPWQFIAGTGKIYDLRIDWWVDDRRNIEKATRAAASHLSDLYEEFHSWPLAFSAYNTGPRRVTRAIARHRTRDYWKLTSLPSQTRNYVPKFMAALYIGKDPERYGFKIPDGDKLAYDIVVVEDATDLRLIAELCECSLEELIELNPYVKRWCTPPGESYDVRVPAGKGAVVAERLAQIPTEERITWRRHRVQKGETLSIVARNYSTSVQAICDANRLKAKSAIRPGNYLIIPVISAGAVTPRAAMYIAEAAKSASVASASTVRRTYVVRRGDTLSAIGRRHKVSVSQLMKWNRKRSAQIRVGERLRIQSPAQAD
jgi:membrane-bound lytic murein transglycosylase D